MSILGVTVIVLAVVGTGALIWLNRRPVHRTREQVIAYLEGGLRAGGESSWDDFVSVRIAEPELEAVRLKCLDVNLSSQAIFEQTLKSLLADLRNNQT